MGNLHAAEFAESVRTGETSLDAALTYQLQGNHFPPIHLDFLPTAKSAIRYAKRGLWEKTIKLPNNKTLTVAAIVRGMHLDSFLE